MVRYWLGFHSSPHTNMPYSDIAQPYDFKCLSGDLTTSSNNYELSKQGSAVISNALPVNTTHKPPHEQTNDEWLNDWEQAWKMALSFPLVGGKEYSKHS